MNASGHLLLTPESSAPYAHHVAPGATLKAVETSVSARVRSRWKMVRICPECARRLSRAASRIAAIGQDQGLATRKRSSTFPTRRLPAKALQPGKMIAHDRYRPNTSG